MNRFPMPSFRLSCALLALCGALTSPLSAQLEVYAETGKPVPAKILEDHGWSAEIRALISHHSRTAVWANHDNRPRPGATHVAFNPKSMKELNNLFALFEKVESRWHITNLIPGKGITDVRKNSYPKASLGSPLIFTVHSAKFLQTWYEALPMNAAGLHYSPHQVFTEPPGIPVPTFLLYAENPVVKLHDIKWPEWAVVRPLVNQQQRKELDGSPILEEIDKLGEEFSSPRCEDRRRRRALEAEGKSS